MEKLNHWIEDWLSTRAESESTYKNYLRSIREFADFCQSKGKDFSRVVESWRAAHYAGAREEQMFLGKWNDLIKRYATFLKTRKTQRGGRYTPLTLKTYRKTRRETIFLS